MKDVKRCSLAGIAFTLDTDAYDALESYLNRLKTRYEQTEGGEEIVADIETRIAELILDRQANSRAVELSLINEIMHQMGSTEEIDGEEPATQPRPMPQIVRRIYRDVEHAKLGGVLAGLAAFFDIDRTWIRLSYFLPVVLICIAAITRFEEHAKLCSFMAQIFAIINICYVIMWFVIPGARTARQKLEMMGERITEQTLRETNNSQRASADPDGRPRTIAAGLLVTIGQILLFFLKFALICLLLPLAFAFGMAVIAFFAALKKGYIDLFSNTYIAPGWIVAVWALTLAIAIALIIYVLFCLIAMRKVNTKILSVFAVIIMACGMATCATVGYIWHDHNRSDAALPAPTEMKENLMNEAVSVGPQGEVGEIAAAPEADSTATASPQGPER